jgi:hypothetical protein
MVAEGGLTMMDGGWRLADNGRIRGKQSQVMERGEARDDVIE